MQVARCTCSACFVYSVDMNRFKKGAGSARNRASTASAFARDPSLLAFTIACSIGKRLVTGSAILSALGCLEASSRTAIRQVLAGEQHALSMPYVCMACYVSCPASPKVNECPVLERQQQR